MDDLTTRLLAAIEETERDAKDMPYDRPGQWWVEKTPKKLAWGESSRIYIESSGGTIAEVDDEAALAADHLARQDPNRVLRRCAADRKIVAEARGLSDGVLKDDPVAALGDLVLALLADGYGITEETDHA
jgi:hypothetical protein